MSAKQKAKGCYLPKYPELDNNTGLVFRAEKSREVFRFSVKTMKCLEQLISVRSCCNVYTNRGNDRFWLASFSCCKKKSHKLKSFSSFISAVSGLILRPKAMELCIDADFKASLGWEDRSKHVGLTQTLSMDHETTPSTTTKCLRITADDDSRLTEKRSTMTKNLNCMKFSQTKWLL